ncbi:vacuolar protein sorting-associated [Pelagophyceae sp. CCMP2097]|nr:vacuolar protein sorting-associated [Pelagophyceae sp. CCMP2097]|mmetsp:Transcript_3107/g.9356  ORF Transcript_3107/g.9356 Transcript_3107/m.9356 type:complete len:208 (+) Transcript_3107:143-766(+)
MSVHLYSDARERRRFDDLADFYAVIKVTEKLEKAYARDAVRPAEYEHACLRLISQFKLSEAALIHDGTIANADEFMKEYKMDCPRARERLLRIGLPATVTHQSAGGAAAAEHAVRVAECVQHFITAMDAVKLEQRAVDEIQPLVADLMGSITRVAPAPCERGRGKLAQWLVGLNALRAADEISEEQARQLSFDLDAAYSEFHQSLRA